MKPLIEEEASSSVSRALLEAGRSVTPSAESQAKLLSVLGVGLATGTATLAGSGSAKAATAGSSLTSMGGKLGLILACGVAGGAGLYAAQDGEIVMSPNVASTSSTPRRAASRARPLDATPSRDALFEVKPPSTAVEDRAVRDESKSTSSAAGSAPRSRGARVRESFRPSVSAMVAPAGAVSSPTTRPDRLEPPVAVDVRLAEELRYLDEARRAVQSADTVVADKLLHQYFSRFPSGFLRPEAEQLRARARAMTPEDRP